jgi:flagellar basal-body rod modification protein FlgD
MQIGSIDNITPQTSTATSLPTRAFPSTGATTSTSSADAAASVFGSFGSGDASSAAGASSKDQFLKLLVAQLEHQNPLSPQDGAAFIAQLAQFTAVEQGAETNQRLANLESEQASGLRTGYANLVGKTIAAKTDAIEIPSTAGSDLSVRLDTAAKSADVDVYDSTGKKVRTIHLDHPAAGANPLAFDGKDDAGGALPNGRYRVEVRALKDDGSTVSATTEVRGIVSSIDFSGGTVRFHIGSLVITPADIESIDA